MFGESHRMNAPGSSSKHEMSGRVFGVFCDSEEALGRTGMKRRRPWGRGRGGFVGGPGHHRKDSGFCQMDCKTLGGLIAGEQHV